MNWYSIMCACDLVTYCSDKTLEGTAFSTLLSPSCAAGWPSGHELAAKCLPLDVVSRHCEIAAYYARLATAYKESIAARTYLRAVPRDLAGMITAGLTPYVRTNYDDCVAFCCYGFESLLHHLPCEINVYTSGFTRLRFKRNFWRCVDVRADGTVTYFASMHPHKCSDCNVGKFCNRHAFMRAAWAHVQRVTG